MMDKTDRKTAPDRKPTIRKAGLPISRTTRTHHQIGVRNTSGQNASAGTVGTVIELEIVAPPTYGASAKPADKATIGARKESGRPLADSHSRRFTGR